jgi:aminomethyltransferase
MPLRYRSIPEEHVQVRQAAGLFDLCHMGRLELAGPDAVDWAGRLLTADLRRMRSGAARYALVLDDRGMILDDTIVYRLPQEGPGERLLLVVNAANRERIAAWFEAHRENFDARCLDRTASLGMVAIQGPRAASLLARAVTCRSKELEHVRYYSLALAEFEGEPIRVARTGYTGEDGFEVYAGVESTVALWKRLLALGEGDVGAIGLGARDTLRLEAGMPLYGNEITSATHPFEAGLGFAVKLEKEGGFIGRESLLELKDRAHGEGGFPRELVGFRVEGRRIARQGMRIFQGEKPVGEVTSGAPSPTLGYPIALAYVSRQALVGGAPLTVDIRGHRETLQRHPVPFFSRTRKPDSREPQA